MFLRRGTAKAASFVKPLVGFWWAAHWCWLHQHTVAASSDALSCPAFDVRMLGGSTEFDGLIVLKDVAGNWSRLCYGYNFDVLLERGVDGAARIAEVACRQLGFKDAKPSVVLYDYEHSPLTQNYSGFVLPYDMRCEGSESHLSECHPYFRDFKDVLAISNHLRNLTKLGCLYGVACRDDATFSVSLESDSRSQIVESLPNGTVSSGASGLLSGTTFGRKGYVCASWADALNRAHIAQVACRQMGYSTGLSLRLNMPEAEKLGGDFMARYMSLKVVNQTCLMPDTTCSGDEKSISECKHWRTWGTLGTLSISEKMWPGYNVPIHCLNDLDDAFEVRLGQQMAGHSESPEGVFIRYGSLWLPLVNITNPYTCNAVCRSLHSSRPMKAICYTEELNETVELGNEDMHSSFVHCDRDEIDIKKCAHNLDSRSLHADDESPLEHLQARCIPPPDNKASNTSRRQVKLVDGEGTLSGCLMVSFDNEWYQAGALDDEEATKVAMAACNYLHYNRTVQFASGHITLDSSPRTCPSASVIVGCGSGDSSITTCAYQKLTAGVPLGIRVFCGVEHVFKLALTTGFTEADGRLELLYGDTRGFVEIRTWNNAAAAVACRELGLNGTGARAIRKAADLDGESWMLDGVECTGEESALIACKHHWILDSFPSFPTYVGGVVCGGNNQIRMEFLNYTSNPGYPAVRMDGGLTYFCFSNTYSEAYSYVSDYSAERVLCKAAGFGRVQHAVRSMTSYEGEALDPGAKAFRNFMCKSKDSPIEECTYEDVVLANACPERRPSTNAWKKIVTLHCEDYQFGTAVRLVGGASPYEGRVEVMYKGEWGAVCDDRFDSTAASVVCSQLFGKSSTGAATPGYRFATGNEKFLLDDVKCSADSKTLAECSHSAWGDHNCGPCEMAGVICTKVPFIWQPTVTMRMKEQKLRLVCSAEADPPAEFMWFSSSATSTVSDNSIEVQCLESEHVIYTCNAINTADEKTTQVIIGPDISCYAKRMYLAEYSSSMDTAGVTAMAVALCLMTLAFLAVFLYAIYIRKALRKATPPSKIQSNISYLNPNFTSTGPS